MIIITLRAWAKTEEEFLDSNVPSTAKDHLEKKGGKQNVVVVAAVAAAAAAVLVVYNKQKHF